ncbi:MAG TPA: hypothetical protein VIF62_17460, partial [Labilithrix sp.]
MTAFVLTGCRGEPPAAKVDAATAPMPSTASTTATATASASTTASATASADGAVDPGTLEQTHDKPKGSGAAFDARVATMWDAIVKDDPDRGMPFFFPVTAYEQVKALTNPAGDWRRRLVANYKRDIHALHARLGDDADDAKLLRVEVPDERARWIEPGEEGNKLGYYRVYGTRIVYDVGG